MMPKVPRDTLLKALFNWHPEGAMGDYSGEARLRRLGVTPKQLERFKQSRKSLAVNAITAAKLKMLAEVNDKALHHSLLRMIEIKGQGKRK